MLPCTTGQGIVTATAWGRVWTYLRCAEIEQQQEQRSCSAPQSPWTRAGEERRKGRGEGDGRGWDGEEEGEREGREEETED